MGTVLGILHVVGAVFIVGPMAILPMTAMRSLRAGQADQVKSLAKTTNIFSWLSILVLIFGFGVAGVYSISFSKTWVWLSIVLYVIALILSLVLVVPAMRRGAAALEATEGADKPAPSGGYGAIAGGSGIATLCLLIV